MTTASHQPPATGRPIKIKPEAQASLPASFPTSQALLIHLYKRRRFVIGRLAELMPYLEYYQREGEGEKTKRLLAFIASTGEALAELSSLLVDLTAGLEGLLNAQEASPDGLPD